MGIQLSVGVVTCERPEVLEECIKRLAVQASGRPVEILICDTAGDDPETTAVVEKWIVKPELTVRRVKPLRVGNISAAWEACARSAHADAVLFLCDDGLATEGLLDRHIEFHQAHPNGKFALQGRITESSLSKPTPFMRWTESSGIRFGCPDATADSVAPWLFRFMNGSVGTKEILATGFDYDFEFGGDDIDMGMRLAARGVTLAYDYDAVVEHFHPTDLPSTMRKLRRYGHEGQKLRQRYPEYPQPRPPAWRHQAWAQLLTALNLLRVRPRPVREETWRFVCTQALREGLWENAVEASEPRVGARLTRIAERDPGAAWPA
ncbi:hypothetical protein BH10ACT11_BH10ACT11_07480 [soil metagenome]